MVNNNLKLGVGIAVIVIVMFSAMVVRYSLKRDPLTIERADKETSQLGDNNFGDGYPTDGEIGLDTDADLLTTLGGDNSEVIETEPVNDGSDLSEEGDAPDGGDDEPAVTQSTEWQDNRRKPETTTTKATSDKKINAGLEVDAAAVKYNSAAAKMDNANAAVDQAKANKNQLQGAYDEAKAKLDEAKKNYDEKQASNYTNAFCAFIESSGDKDAAALLEGSELASAVDPKDKGDAASFDSIRRSIELLKAANYYRTYEGSGELKVSYKLMAMAVLNNDAMASDGREINDTGLDQNLAFGFEDPFQAWYYGERDDRGGNYNSLMNNDYVVAGFACSDKNGTVHNMIFADAKFSAGKTVSVEQFEEDFEKFRAEAMKGKGYSEEEAAYKSAEEALEQAKQALADREKEAKTATSEFETAKKDYEKKLKAYEDIED